MDNLKIIKATYYDPQTGVEHGADVTEELSAEISDGKLFYNGIYNLIFPDPFVGKPKRLRVQIEHLGKQFTKFYNENEKINLPRDLGEAPRDNAPNRGHIAVRMTESARNNVFINSHIHGGVEIAGQGNRFIETTIKTLREKKKENPFWFWFTVLGTIVGIVTGLMFLGEYFGVLPDSFRPDAPIVAGNVLLATSTPNLADILARNNKLSTSLEKQDFIKNYANMSVYGSGAFVDISKMDQGYIVQMTIANNAVSCQFSFDYEKNLLLLSAGKMVNFSGTFTGSGLGFGSGGVSPWYVEDCMLLP